MRIEITKDFRSDLEGQVRYISKDKPAAARKFKSDLIKKLRKDLKYPFLYKRSIYFENDNIRDYVFKGYTIVYFVNVEQQIVTVFGFIKYKDSL